METPEVAHFRRCILGGNWTEAEACLSSMGVMDGDELRVCCHPIDRSAPN
jgi:hypothetical protein